MQIRATVSTAIRRWKEHYTEQQNVDDTDSKDEVYDEHDRVIDEIVLVGGSSRVLCVRDVLRETVGGVPEGRWFTPHQTPAGTMEAGRDLCTSLDPERAVAQGNI